MSCETLNQGSTGLSVSMAQLPEGFCPANMQELANAIAARLIVSPNQAFTSFAAGSVEPSSNVGPWLKDCLEWFVFDDATARYVAIPKGFNNMQYFVTPGAGTFIVPANTYKLKIHAWGAGGGGSSNDGAGSSGSGGGGGGYGQSIETVTPGQSISFSIGLGGPVGANGTNTTIFGHTAGGGVGAPAVTTSGTGGVATGFIVNISGGNGMANTSGSTQESGNAGGDAGGWGGAGGISTVSSSAVGVRVGVHPGGGGGGGTISTTSIGGSGANGAILIEY